MATFACEEETTAYSESKTKMVFALFLASFFKKKKPAVCREVIVQSTKAF